MLNLDALRAAKTREAPFTYLAAQGALSRDEAAGVREDFPAIDKTGYLPLSRLEARGRFAELVEDLRSEALAEVLSDKLRLDLVGKPRMITVRRLSKAGDGRIHNDSASKICTMLVYLNDEWDPAEGGAIRALNGPDDMDDYAEEVAPVAGNVFAFARSETSWHGHPPFAGERYVIQTTFLTSEEELDRKEKRGGLQMRLKRLFER
ncbi:2OG-Fe(II) oxygenase [Parvularcula oceani]|uniref:2OG-Fe(II) oxygenase n=1 Tax=Parvularcula oceani TaxID=1247963 RepID=UPI0004E1D02B|nr:2OG-Fe(II) oxygenase [Parvularcula oceani]